MPELHTLHLEPIVDRSLQEDWGSGDWTTDLCVSKTARVHADIIAKKPTYLSGLEVAQAVFTRVNPMLGVKVHQFNGQYVEANETILSVTGDARSILKAERVAFNFLARMSGITQRTREFVKRLEGYKTELLDTRKTTPGLRLIEKRATAVSGARNHRLCLTDGVLVKENHIKAAGNITTALSHLLESLPPTLKIEVEVTNLDQVHEALEAGADLIMLDNMSPSTIAMAVRTVRERVLLEASGNITLDNIEEIAATGVNFVSSSSILHSAPWADLSLLIR